VPADDTKLRLNDHLLTSSPSTGLSNRASPKSASSFHQVSVCLEAAAGVCWCVGDGEVGSPPRGLFFSAKMPQVPSRGPARCSAPHPHVGINNRRPSVRLWSVHQRSGDPQQYLTFSKLSLALDNLVAGSPLAAFLNKVELCTFSKPAHASKWKMGIETEYSGVVEG